MKRAIPLILGLLVSMTAASQGFDRPVGEPFASRSEVIAMNGMAATSQPLATQIALDILKKAERIDEIPLIVDFWASWCGPCRMMAPEFSKASQALRGHARFAKLDTEAFPEAGARYGIRGIPLLIAFRGGREIGRRTGAISAGDIADWVTAGAGA